MTSRKKFERRPRETLRKVSEKKALLLSPTLRWLLQVDWTAVSIIVPAPVLGGRVKLVRSQGGISRVS